MSQLLVQNYLSEIDRLRRFSGVNNEQVIRSAFKRLLDQWANSLKLAFIEELPYQTSLKTTVRPDGTVLHDIRVPLGYWEAKDTDDDLDEEIAKKLRRGYPQDNIIFENSRTAVLWQNRQEVMRCSMTDTAALLRLLELFFDYERPEIAQFRKAVEQFKADLPAVLEALREKIDAAYADNEAFRAAADTFLTHARETINPSVGEADVREMLIQHILTEDIFNHVFNDADFHRQNNIARLLYALEEKFFTGAVKRDTMRALEPYYAAIRTNAAQITAHSEKQTFLKAIYENFYKVYNPKAADRLGVVYTPNEIVKFMIEGADWLCHKHFGKTLIDREVEILDPATGTGTFICELIEHFRGDRDKLAYKYRNELHANEVAILPYYVANLNIEATYFGVTGQYAEFENLCFVDTLDNINGLGVKTNHQYDLFAALSEENSARVRRQNKRKISLIIGNPPYNAWQESFNLRNPNRPYKHVDERIHDTYIKYGHATNQSSVYDMYTRFFRWASDRIGDEGIVAFITGRKPFSKGAYDGFRKVIEDEFSSIYIVDLGGDITDNPQLSGTKHNVFGIKVGVAISFLVKHRKKQPSRIFYVRRPEAETAKDKLSFLASHSLDQIGFENIESNNKFNWIDKPTNSWEDLAPLCAKNAVNKRGVHAIFGLVSNGMQTKKDEWAYDSDEMSLARKASYLIDAYIKLSHGEFHGEVSRLKIDREAERLVNKKSIANFSSENIVVSQFRPFVEKYLYFNRSMNSVSFRIPLMFPIGSSNRAIAFLSESSANPLAALACSYQFDLCLLKNGNGSTRGVSRYRYTKDGERVDNITDWGLRQFEKHYGKRAKITKDDIFHYVYGVLHDPVYREKYALNLKREFPRIPFYPDFRRWTEWGEVLMALHIGYEEVEPWPLTRTDVPDEKASAAGLAPKALLKADRDAGLIRLDSETTLSGIPKEAWDYRLGNRSALDWILDQYKEKTPKDPTIRERFNTYRFADYKEKVVDLLMRVTRVSVETVAITEAMRGARRDEAAEAEPLADDAG